MHSMNQVTIHSDRQLTETEVNNIRDIMLHSGCPNESLKFSFSDCQGLNADNEIIFGEGAPYTEVIEY